MPHICLRCKTRLEAVKELAPRCPVCGGTKFSFVSARQNQEKEIVPAQTPPPVPHETLEITDPVPESERKEKKPEPYTEDSIESIHILEPGRYDLNLLRLVESDDRVIKVGNDANYRLDLHSMVRSKKKD